MIRWFLRRWIDKFERLWGYDASYLRDVLDADPRALLAFSKVAGIGNYRKDVPLPAYCAAGIVSVISEDCGPCTQLAINMAERAGVDPAILVLRRFGKRGLVSLAFAMIAARLYPTLKYVMGHGQACKRVTIGGETRPMFRELTRAE